MNPHSSQATAEKPVFAATGAARPRALKLVGRAAAGLVGLWLVALVLGAFGFGHVPGFQLPRIAGGDDAKAEMEPPKGQRASVAPAESAIRIGTHTGTAAPLSSRGPASNARTRRASTGRGTGGSRGGDGGTRSTGNSGSTPPASASAPGTHPIAPSPSANSNATPQQPSSAAPGSRSQSTTAPGRTQSQATPTPGQGQGQANGRSTTAPAG